jgi:hypothetical protein
VLRHALALERQLRGEGKQVAGSSPAEGRLDAALPRLDVVQACTGFSDRPAYADAQAIAHRSPSCTSRRRSTAS